MNKIYYSEPVYRPPSEASSLLIQVTEGCTFRCHFCISNTKKFKIRKFKDIKKDLDTAKKIYGENVQGIFLLDGNAMVVPFEKLFEIIKYSRTIFPNLKRIGLYAHAKDILNKTNAELKSLFNLGLKIIYIGIESGNDELLMQIGKNVTSAEIIEAFHKCFQVGITPSGTVILGLTGKNTTRSQRHMQDTAKLVNNANPAKIIKTDKLPIWYISCLALMFPYESDIYGDLQKGKFVPQTANGILYEMKTFIENISSDVQNCVFRSNHASNYLPIKGRLSRDKNKILEIIQNSLENPEKIRPEYLRGL